MNSSEALNKLIEGNKRFVENKPNNSINHNERLSEMVDAQTPFAIILSCADSRVVPEIAFDVSVGELFVIRVAGNVANTDTVASIEYAVAFLKPSLIVVMGHQNCGAVSAALKFQDNGYNLNHLLSHVLPSVSASTSSEVNDVVKTNAQYSAKHLVEKSEIIKKAVDDGSTQIKSAYFSLENGEVSFI